MNDVDTAARVPGHPVQLVVRDDLDRSRATVFLRLLLAIPHFIWVLVFSIVAFLAAVVAWFATLGLGRLPRPLHGLLGAYVRYVTHLNAYLWIAADPYPRFDGEPGSYPIDVTLPEPEPQPRWSVALRLPLAVPALLLAVTLGGSSQTRLPVGAARAGALLGGGAVLGVVGFLGWFASLARARMPRGLRDAAAYSLGYGAQTLAYLLLVTDRYPDSDPAPLLARIEPPPLHPVGLADDRDDLRRSRLTVFFRLPLAVPHLVWLALWSVLALLAAIANWLATLVRGAPPRPLHRFLGRYVRYQFHVAAFLYLAANPFPGFTGLPDSYPLGLHLPRPGRQSRWKTGFRALLAVPAWLLASALGGTLAVCALLAWFAALARGRAPRGLHNLSAYALRYSAQLYAYLTLLTDAYPHASPLEGAAPDADAVPPM